MSSLTHQPAHAAGDESLGLTPPWCSIIIAFVLAMASLLIAGLCGPNASAAYGFGAIECTWPRLIGSFFTHLDPTHLILNVLYLISVGYFVEPMIGAGRTTLILLVAHVAGAAAVAQWADPAYVEIGASNGVHGLLAAGYVVQIRRTRETVVRVVCAAGLGYFGFMTAYSITTGHMPWPVSFFVNCGWGHLGGIATSIALGTVMGTTALPPDGRPSVDSA